MMIFGSPEHLPAPQTAEADTHTQGEDTAPVADPQPDTQIQEEDQTADILSSDVLSTDATPTPTSPDNEPVVIWVGDDVDDF